MSKWTIYNRSGVAKLVASDLEYHDTWMGEEFVTVNISSATPIDLEIGDYLTYRGLTYTIYNLPTALKQARSGSSGEAFKYDGVKFSARSTELTEIRFFDIVLHDNEMHYTSMPTFQFYAETVDDFLDRIQANTDRDSGHTWVIVSPDYTRTVGRYTYHSTAWWAADTLWRETFGEPNNPSGMDISKEKKNVNISIDKQSIFDSLQHIKNSFGLNFITRERTIVVGGEGIAAGHLFQYGKGNGLHQIERSADAEQQIVTKLFAYGSDKNIPTRYYADLGKSCYVNSESAITPTVTSNSVEIYFEVDVVLSKYYTKQSASSSLYKLVKLSCDNIIVQGFFYDDHIHVISVSGHSDWDYIEQDYSKAVAFANAISGDTSCVIVDGINTEIWPTDHIDYSTTYLPNNMAVNVLMLPGFPKYPLGSGYDADNNWVDGLCKAEYDQQTNKTTISVRKTPSSQYNTLMELEGDYHLLEFSTDRLRPFVVSPNFADLGVKEGDIHFVEENDDNGLKEVCPSVEGMTEDDVFNNGSSARLDVIVACETITDDGRYRTDDPDYKFPNFHITIPNLGFDLRQTAEDSGADVTISLTDGYCGGRDFKVHDINQNDDLTWDLEVERCPDDTLSLMFPYSDSVSHGGSASSNEPYQIRTGDHYVLTGINIKETSYIWGASVEALRKAITWLLNNDYTRFTYLPKVDEIYMKRQDDIAKASQGTVQSMHDTLKAGHLMLFQDTDLNVDGSVFIDQLTIKEDGNNGIPTYDVVLRNDKQVGTMQRVQNQLNSLTSFVAGGGGGYNAQQIRSLIRAYGAELFLSKLTDDSAQGFIRLLQGLQVGEQFVTGLLGEGGVFRMDDDGKTYIEADKMYVRMKAYFDSVEIREYKYTGGNRIASVAGNKAVRVEWIKIVDGQETILDQTTASPSSADFYRCYFRASDGEDTVRNNFVVGDMVYCHITSIAGGSDDPEQKGLNQKHYWRLCIGRNVDGTLTEDGEAWIDVSNRANETINSVTYAGYQSGSDVPAAQDSMIQLGNVNDNTRQGAIIEFVTGADAPSYQIYQGIGADSSNIYSLNSKNQVAFGYNTATGHAYMNVYGDAYIGDRNGTTFVKYEQNNPTTHAPKLTIKAEIEAQSTIGGQSIDDYIAGNEAINNMIEGLQDQIDGAIETYFLEGTPSLQTPPVINPQGGDYPTPWLDGTETAAEREKILNRHLSDMYYDIADPDDSQTSGFAYRFIKDINDNYTWQYIDDTAITAALAKAAQALNVADSKAKVFKTASGVLPPAPYKVNDIWVNATGTWGTGASAVTWSNEILKCITACPSTGTPDISHWDKASKYTDDTRVEGFISELLDGNADTEVALTAAIKAIRAAVNKGVTSISGGLILSNEIELRDTASTPKVWSGISGIYDSTVLGGGIGSWYGGIRLDYETLTEAQKQQGWSNLRWAKSLFRFDGSGYLAGGNITWDATGKVTIKDLHTDDGNLSVDVLQEMTAFRSMFDLSLWQSTSRISPLQNFDNVKITHSNGYTFTDNDVLNRSENDARYLLVDRFFELFDVYNGDTNYTQTFKTSGLPSSTTNISIKAKFGFWTDQYLSALGQNTSGGGSGGGVDLSDVWSAMAQSTNEQINLTHLTNALASALGNYSTKLETIQNIQNNGNSYLITRADGTTFNIDAACAIDISDYFSGGYMSIGDGYMYYYNGTPLEIRKYSETTSTTITYLVFAERRGDYNPNSHYASSFPYPYEVHLFACNSATMCEYVDTYSWSDASSTIKKLWGDGLCLPLSGGTMANTNLVTNLNADLLDGYNANEFLLKTGGTLTGNLTINQNNSTSDLYLTVQRDLDRYDSYKMEVHADAIKFLFSYYDWDTADTLTETGTLKMNASGNLLYNNNVLATQTWVSSNYLSSSATLDNIPDGTTRKLSDYFKRIDVGRLPEVGITNAIYIAPSENPSEGNLMDEWYRIAVLQIYVNGQWMDTVNRGTALGWEPDDASYYRDIAEKGDVLLISDAVGDDDAIDVCEVPYEETPQGTTPAEWVGYGAAYGDVYTVGSSRYVYLSTGWNAVASLANRTVYRWEKVGGIGTVTRIVLGSTNYNPNSSGIVTLPAYPSTLDEISDGTTRKLSDYFKRIDAVTLPALVSADTKAIYVIPSENPVIGNLKEEWCVVEVLRVNIGNEYVDVMDKGSALGWEPEDYSTYENMAGRGDVLLITSATGLSNDAIDVCEVPYDGVNPAEWGGYAVDYGTAYTIGGTKYVYVPTGWKAISTLTTTTERRWEKIGGNSGVSKIVVGSNTYNAIGDTITLGNYVSKAGDTITGALFVQANMTVGSYDSGGGISNNTLTVAGSFVADGGSAATSATLAAGSLTFAYQTTSAALGLVTTGTYAGRLKVGTKPLAYLDDIPSVNYPVTSVVNQTGDVTASQIGSALTAAGYALTDTWQQVSPSQAGYVPQFVSTGGAITSSTVEFVLVFANAQGETAPRWKTLPVNAFNDTTYSNATQSAAGLMSSTDKTKLDGIESNANNYSLPLADSGTRGGVKVGFTTDGANRNYAVQLSNEQMYVNVPWTDTTYDLSGYLQKAGGTMTGQLNVTANVMVGTYDQGGGISNNKITVAGTVVASGGSSTYTGTLSATSLTFGFRGTTAALSLVTDSNSSYQGRLQVGSNPIAYVSDIPSISGYATQSWVNTQLSSYLPLSGGTLSGSLAVNNASTYGDFNVFGTSFFGKGTGSSSIDSQTYALQVGTQGTRTTGSGTYYGGIAFNHMINYQSVSDYHVAPQAWIGIKLYDTPGSERSSLVFATKEGTNTSGAGTDIPTERMIITPVGDVGIGTGSPSYKLDVNGTINASGTITQNGNAVIHSGNIGSQSVNYATTATQDGSGNVITSTYVPKRQSGASYNNLAYSYSGAINPVYWRVALPTNTAAWAMIQMQFSLIQKYSTGLSGRITVYGNWSSSKEWNQLYAYVDGNISTTVKVYASNKKYIYIYTNYSWETLSLDKMICSDNITSQDISDVTIDYVSSIPETYQTATMLYAIHSGNIGSQSVSYASSSNYAGWTQTLFATTDSVGLNSVAFNSSSCQYGIITGGTDSEITDWLDTYNQATYLNLPWENNSWGCQIMYGVNSGKIGYRAKLNGSWSSVKKFITSDNIIDQSVNYATSAGTATQLQTARNIWGQSFDGTGNVSGALTDVTSVSASSYGLFGGSSGVYVGSDFSGSSRGHDCIERAGSGNTLYLQYYNTGAISMCYGGGKISIGTNTSAPTRNLEVWGNAHVRGDLLIGTSGSADLSFGRENADNYINVATGGKLVFYTSGTGSTGAIASNGNWGIGTTSPSYKLDVNGTLRASGNATFGTAGSHVSIGTAVNSNYTLTVGGDTYIDGDLYLADDRNILLGSSYINASDNNYFYVFYYQNDSWFQILNWDSNGYGDIRFKDVFYLTEENSGDTVLSYSTGYGYLSANKNTKFSGYVGIGTDPDTSYKLKVNGKIYGTDLYINNSAASILSTSPASGVRFWAINGSGGAAINCNGSVSATSFVNNSDARKKNIYDYNALVDVNTIAMAPAIRFTWKDGEDRDLHCGTIAQYWNAVMPECVQLGYDGYLSMQYDIIALLASISIAKKVVNHEERITELEKENERLRTEFEQLRLSNAA